MAGTDPRTRLLVDTASRAVLAAATSPKQDIQMERLKATFSPDELACFLAGGKDKLQRRWSRAE